MASTLFNMYGDGSSSSFDDPFTQMLLAGAAQAFQGGPNFGSTLGRTMYSAGEGYRGALEFRDKREEAAYRKRLKAAEVAKLERTEQEKRIMSEVMRKAAEDAGRTAPGTVPAMAFTPEVNAGLARSQPAPPASAREATRRRLQKEIDLLIKGEHGHMVGPLQEKLAKMEPELKEIVTESKGGKRVRVAYFKDGTYQEVPFEPDLSKLQFTDTGDRAGVGIDPFTGQQRSSGFAKGMDPGQRDASNRGWQGLNLQRDQFERGRTVYDTERGASVNLDTNTATPVKMAGQPLPAKVPESAKKEVMSIDQQLAAVKGAMDAVKSTPSAFSFGRGAATMAGPMSESVRGRFDNTKEQQARSYVFNVVSKVINERAGAAQSAQELARLRSFLPAETDSPGQVESKLQGFEKYLGDLRGAVTGVAGPTGQTSSPSASGRSPTGGRHSVTAPGGKVYYFTSAAAADGFRKMSGGQ